MYWGDTATSIRFLRLGWQCLGYHDYPWLINYPWLIRVEGWGSPIPVASQHLLIMLARAPQPWTGGDVSKKEKIFPFGGHEMLMRSEWTRYCCTCNLERMFFSKYTSGSDNHDSASVEPCSYVRFQIRESAAYVETVPTLIGMYKSFTPK